MGSLIAIAAIAAFSLAGCALLRDAEGTVGPILRDVHVPDDPAAAQRLAEKLAQEAALASSAAARASDLTAARSSRAVDDNFQEVCDTTVELFGNADKVAEDQDLVTALLGSVAPLDAGNQFRRDVTDLGGTFGFHLTNETPSTQTQDDKGKELALSVFKSLYCDLD